MTAMGRRTEKRDDSEHTVSAREAGSRRATDVFCVGEVARSGGAVALGFVFSKRNYWVGTKSLPAGRYGTKIP